MAITCEQLTFPLHTIVPPVAFIITPILEEVFTSAMLLMVLLLAYVRVTIVVQLMY